MTLRELSYEYREHANAISGRIRALRLAAREAGEAGNTEEKNRLELRIAELRPLLQEARELAVLTRHYYDRRYRRNDKYTL